MTNLLLEFDEMYEALVSSNSEYDGVFFVGVRTTGIFCRATCSARTPNRENVSFFEKTSDALAAGYRPCKRCRPMEVSGKMPQWLEQLVDEFESEPGRKWKDQDIRDFGADPKRVRRWFLTNHGITFHTFMRSRRLSTALAQISLGQNITQTAYDCGYESVSGFRTAFQQWFGCSVGHAATAGSAIMVNRLLTPLGPMICAADEDQLYLLEFADRRQLETQFKRLNKLVSQPFVPGESSTMHQVQRQLDQYFSGELRNFDLPLFLKGSTFQETVWNQLLKLDYGQTVSYEWIAQQIGNPRAQRAVGKANGDNRIAIIVPCHRVIRQNGELSGYGGGVRRKQWMLDQEQAQCQSALQGNPSRQLAPA